MTTTQVFISHSSRDAELAHAVVDLLRSALNLRGNRIRCTSVDGHRLEGGDQTDLELRREIVAAEVFLGLVSPISIESAYVLFEMGARWGSDKRLIPLLAPGADSSHLRGPLAGVNALHCTSEPDLHRLVAHVGAALQLPLEPTSVFLDELRAVQQKSSASLLPSSPPASAPVAQWLVTDKHEAIMKLFAEATWKRARPESLADLAGMNRTRMQHLLDQLLEVGWVLISETNTGGVYSLSKAGRAHAVDRGYC